MRFDLEIQQDPIRLTYVEAGKDIDQSFIPYLYLNTNNINAVPKDYVVLDTSSELDENTESPIFIANIVDSEFRAESDKILITHIALYSKITNTKTPIFYCHTIDLSKYDNIENKFNYKSVIISTIDGTVLDEDMYLVEYDDKIARIYVNPIDLSLLQVQWSDNNIVHKELLKLEPAYKDMGSYFNYSYLGKYEFTALLNDDRNSFTVKLGKEKGLVYYKLKTQSDLVSPPICNMDDKWYLQIENILVNAVDKDDIKCSYRLPEYYLQKQFDANNNTEFNGLYKKYTKQVAKIVNSTYVQTQLSPAISMLNKVDIEIYSLVTDTLEYAFTTDTNKINDTHSLNHSVVWEKVEDYTYDGYFDTGKQLNKDASYAKVSYYIDNKYYEFRYLDIKNTSLDATKLLALYIAPTYTYNDPDTFKMYYVFIGSQYADDISTSKNKVMGATFSSKDQYEEFLNEYSNLNVCYVSMDMSKLASSLSITECKSTNIDTPLLSTEESSQYSDSVLSKLIQEDRIRLPLEDTAYIHIDKDIFTSRLISASREEKEFIDFVKKTSHENITISTNLLIAKNYIISEFLPEGVDEWEPSFPLLTRHNIYENDSIDATVEEVYVGLRKATVYNENMEIEFGAMDALHVVPENISTVMEEIDVSFYDEKYHDNIENTGIFISIRKSDMDLGNYYG